MLIVGLLFLLGVAIGVFSSYFGLGGGVFVVPILVSFFPGMPQQMAAGTSLGMIFFNSCIHLYTFYKSGNKANPKTALLLGLSIITVTVLAGTLSFSLSQMQLRLIFGFILLGATWKTLAWNPAQENLEGDDAPIHKYFVTGAFGGLISGLTGLGGGLILIPLLLTYVKIPVKKVSVYGQSSMALGSLAGLASYMLNFPKGEFSVPYPQFAVGSVNFLLILPLVLGTLFTSKLGVKLNNKANPAFKKKILVALFLIMAAKIFYQAQKLS